MNLDSGKDLLDFEAEGSIPEKLVFDVIFYLLENLQKIRVNNNSNSAPKVVEQNDRT